MSSTECRKFESQLACSMAPSLLGIKCANLISLSRSEYDLPAQLERFNRRAATKGLQLKLLCICQTRALILHYNTVMLERQLAGLAQRAILQQFGYQENDTLESKLNRLAMRIQSEPRFPHEIGVFLGYPPEDVLGFMENQGENYKICGYWKVYGDPEQAKRTFTRYDRCRNFLCHKLMQCYDIYQALKIS